jgi:phosphate transport system substrate-binding protein
MDFLTWMLDSGEPMATQLTYAPLPKEVAEKVRATIKQIR